MKRFVLWAVVPAFIVIGSIAYHHARTPRYVPAIAVSIADESTGGTDYLPAVDGYASGHGGSMHSEGTKEIYHADETFKVISTAPGGFVVHAHYIVTRDGVSKPFDRTLSVWEKEPEKSKWVKIDDHLVACAYLSATTLNY